MSRSGAQILVDTLVDEGVKHIFGIPGGVVIPIFDVLYDSPIDVILTRHEQGAGHAADGYARASGKVGVCIATSGPGACNLVTAIATANFDSVPLVALTGQVRTILIGNDAFQEADIVGITRPITKHNFLVRDVAKLGYTVRAAFHIAQTGRPGPVLIDIPVDVSTAQTDVPTPKEISLPGYRPHTKGNVRQIRLAADAINKAQRPLIYVGGGAIIAGCADLVRELAETSQIPVTTTLMGLGAFPEDHPLSLKMLGMHGTAYANFAMQHADTIIAIGARFDDRITGKLDEFAPQRECIIHIDIDPASISKSIQVDIPVVGDARNILRQLVKLVQPVDRTPWLTLIAEWKAKHPLSYNNADGTLKPQYVIQQICDVTRGEAIICTEVGQNQMWAAQWFTHRRPRHFISSGGLGTMGYGFPAAMGAQVACPGQIVFDIAGDGSFQMNIQELATVVRRKLPVKVAILNNGYLGMVRQWQEMFFKKRYSATVLSDGNPDFVAVAQAYGAKGIRVEHTDQVRPALEDALATDGPVVLDFRINPEENVFPMVPAGEAIHRMRGLA
ncbi:MAG TPA: biosynthetic-type acetolactate synthase large subunit [Planctomycetota bacterium]|nr:biosynthetic-type acetolactate synthase large subunit [Planctomycetota bacterium]HRR79447.1 biosynthetic-type acetolactate synthase large subunit [Planctomycetota bacterium]HRT94509.1 biosynthetic-type acetolactate synthase large subunit [Planctomycetota bacterium]